MSASSGTMIFNFFPTFWKYLFYIQKELICLKAVLLVVFFFFFSLLLYVSDKKHYFSLCKPFFNTTYTNITIKYLGIPMVELQKERNYYLNAA